MSFQEAPAHHGSAGATHVLHHQLQQALGLMERLARLHQRVAGSREYVRHRMRRARRAQIEVGADYGTGGAGAGAGAGTGGFEDEQALLQAATIASIADM